MRRLGKKEDTKNCDKKYTKQAKKKIQKKRQNKRTDVFHVRFFVSKGLRLIFGQAEMKEVKK